MSRLTESKKQKPPTRKQKREDGYNNRFGKGYEKEMEERLKLLK